jgi:hypothetical protein
MKRVRDKGKQSIAAKRHYQKNRAALISRAADFSQRNRQVLRAYVEGVKSQPCKDCGVSYPPYLMDFDHRGDKIRNVSDMAHRSVGLETLKAEIAKCDVVCANCHRIRTHKPQLEIVKKSA